MTYCLLVAAKLRADLDWTAAWRAPHFMAARSELDRISNETLLEVRCSAASNIATKASYLLGLHAFVVNASMSARFQARLYGCVCVDLASDGKLPNLARKPGLIPAIISHEAVKEPDQMTSGAACWTTTSVRPSAATSTLTVYVQPWLTTCARILVVAHTASMS